MFFHSDLQSAAGKLIPTIYICWTLASLAVNRPENFEANINVDKCLPF